MGQRGQVMHAILGDHIEAGLGVLDLADGDGRTAAGRGDVAGKAAEHRQRANFEAAGPQAERQQALLVLSNRRPRHADKEGGADHAVGHRQNAVGRIQRADLPLFHRRNLGMLHKEGRQVVGFAEATGVQVFAGDDPLGRMKTTVGGHVATADKIREVRAQPFPKGLLVRRLELSQRINFQRLLIQAHEARDVDEIIREVDQGAGARLAVEHGVG